MKALTKGIGGAVVILGVSSGVAIAQTPDLSQLVGEWSEPGACGHSRYSFTSDGRYLWLENQGNGWNSRFEGIYVVNNAPISVTIAADYNMGGDTLELDTLSSSVLAGRWVTEGSEPFGVRYTRCPDR